MNQKNLSSNYLEIVDIEDKMDVMGRSYKRMTLRDVIFDEGERIHGIKLRKIAVYKTKGNDLFYKGRGTLLVGKLVTREVHPYEAYGKEQSVYTLPIFHDPNSPSFEEIVKYTFDKEGKTLVNTRTNDQSHMVW